MNIDDDGFFRVTIDMLVTPEELDHLIVRFKSKPGDPKEIRDRISSITNAARMARLGLNPSVSLGTRDANDDWVPLERTNLWCRSKVIGEFQFGQFLGQNGWHVFVVRHQKLIGKIRSGDFLVEIGDFPRPLSYTSLTNGLAEIVRGLPSRLVFYRGDRLETVSFNT